MEQRIVITKSQEEINILIREGWKVISVTPQFVSVSMSGNSYGSQEIKGDFCFLLEKT